jgi:iron(III) transport system ATP-binding protein
MPSISVKGLNKSFGAFKAVSDVAFEVPEGGFCTLLGPSGCGKTTTLRLIAGLERLDSGTIAIGDKVVNSREVYVPAENRRLGYVFQSYALWPHMTVLDQVAYPLRAQGVARQQIPAMVAEALDAVGLSVQAGRYPSELSGGQQQRVALARALVFRPSVLLLDEPLSNLDAELRVQLRAELHELRRRINVTTIHVTHDQHEALSLSDLVVVMDSGQVIETGTPHDIYAHPKELHTAMFVGSGNTLEGRVSAITAEGVRVRLGDGTELTGLAPSSLTEGEAAVVLFRPEDVEVVAAADPAAELQGVVVARMYYGGHTALTLRAAGAELRVETGKFDMTKTGDTVGLVFARNSVLVFRHEPARSRRTVGAMVAAPLPAAATHIDPVESAT